MFSEKEFIEMCEPDRPLRLSASVYKDCTQTMLVEPRHYFGDRKRTEFIKESYRQIKSAAEGYRLDRFISNLSGDQHVLQLNFIK